MRRPQNPDKALVPTILTGEATFADTATQRQCCLNLASTAQILKKRASLFHVNGDKASPAACNGSVIARTLSQRC